MKTGRWGAFFTGCRGGLGKAGLTADFSRCVDGHFSAQSLIHGLNTPGAGGMDLLISPPEGEVPRGDEPSAFLVGEHPGADEPRACCKAETGGVEVGKPHAVFEQDSIDDSMECDGDSSTSSSRVDADGKDDEGPVFEVAAAETSLLIHGEPILGMVDKEDDDDSMHSHEGAEDRWGCDTTEGVTQIHASAEDGTGQDEAAGEGPFSSEEEEDVLQIEGIEDNDQVALLPTTVQDVEDCSDVGPPALPHLALAASGAAFGEVCEEASSTISDAEAAGYDDYEDEDEDVDENEDEAQGESQCMDEDDVGFEEKLVAAVCSSDKVNEGLARTWIEKYERLKAFKQRYGHAHVRQDEPLGAWVCVQRQKFKQGKLLRERELLLKTVGERHTHTNTHTYTIVRLDVAAISADYRAL